MASKVRSGLKLLIIAVLFLIITTAAAYVITKNILVDDPEQQAKKQYITYPLGDYLTNLADRGYVKISIVCLLSDKKTEKEMQQKEYEIKDGVYAILRSKTYDSLKDSKGMEVLKKELKDMINKVVDNGKVEEVYFTSIIVN
ncbi:MAG: flagellar protein FliL [Tepidanaerobacteraceae bacterium]|nr:flagellar protein FliL [Tepidanaerobacteraceae bacterium]